MLAFTAQISEGAGLRAVHTFSTAFGPMLGVTAALVKTKNQSVVDFEIFPHYDKDVHEKLLADYRKTTSIYTIRGLVN